MQYAIPTVDEFKAQFARDFPYAVPAWGAAAALTITGGVITSAVVTAAGHGYSAAPTVTVADETGSGAVLEATVDGGSVTALAITTAGTGYSSPVVTFSGGAGDETDLERVRDADIVSAFDKAALKTNPELWPTEAAYKLGYNLAAAHFLQCSIQAAMQGLKGQGIDWITSWKSAGSLAASYVIPERIQKSPFFAGFCKTAYGCQYLEMICPYLVGNMVGVYRTARGA